MHQDVNWHLLSLFFKNVTPAAQIHTGQLGKAHAHTKNSGQRLRKAPLEYRQPQVRWPHSSAHCQRELVRLPHSSAASWGGGPIRGFWTFLWPIFFFIYGCSLSTNSTSARSMLSHLPSGCVSACLKLGPKLTAKVYLSTSMCLFLCVYFYMSVSMCLFLSLFLCVYFYVSISIRLFLYVYFYTSISIRLFLCAYSYMPIAVCLILYDPSVCLCLCTYFYAPTPICLSLSVYSCASISMCMLMCHCLCVEVSNSLLCSKYGRR